MALPSNPARLVARLALVALLSVVPALEAADPPLALVGATVHVGGGAEPLNDAVVVVRDGRIEAVGGVNDVAIPIDARVVSVAGLTITPGFVDAAHHLELAFPDAVPHQGRVANDTRDVFVGMLDANRRGLVPEREAWRVLNQDASDRKDHREHGFTSLVVAPSGELIAGTGALIAANGRPPRESVRDGDVAMFGSLTWRSRPEDYGGNEYPATLMGVMAHLRQVLLDAGHHRDHAARFADGDSDTAPLNDPALMALEPVLTGETTLVMHADIKEDVQLVLRIADEFPGLKVAIAGGLESHAWADDLARRGVSVIHDLDFGKEPEEPGAKDGKKTVKAAKGRRGRGRADRGESEDEGDDDTKDEDAEDDEEDDDDDTEDEAEADKEPSPVLAPFNPGLPTRVRADRHARWLENVTGVAELFEAGVDVRFATRSRDPKELVESVRIAIEKGGLTHDQALAGLTGGAAVESGEAGSLVAWKGAMFDEKSKARVVVVDGLLFDLRDVAERRTVVKAADDADDDSKDGEEKDDEADSDDESSDDEISVPLVEWPAELDEDRVPKLRTGGDVLIRNVTILTASDGTLVDHDMLVRDGKIAELGQGLAAVDDVAEVDASGMFLTPGIIDCHSHAGIRGGINEWTRSVTAEVTIEDEVDPDDVNLYRALAGGVTSIRQLHGSANVIGGRHAIIKLRWGKTADEMLFEGAPAGVKFALGENPKRSNWGDANRFPGSRMGVEASLRRTFEAGLRYVEDHARYERGEISDPPRRDLRLEAIAGILDGSIGVHSHCYRADEILMLMGVAEDYGFKVATLQHVLEGYKIGREIAAHGGLGGSTFVDWWAFKAEAYETTPYNTALMHEAGVLMSINSDSDEHLRRLYLEAAKAVKYGGMDEEAALKTVTLNPAIQLGIADRVGSIEVGKDADFALFSHHPFDVRTACMHTFVDGECYFTRDASVYDAWRRDAQLAHALPPVPDRGSADARTRDVDAAAAIAALGLPRAGTKATTTPARPAPQTRMALVGGTVHTLDADGTVHEPGVVHIENGRIVAVAAGGTVRAGFETIDVTGKHVWPGMIDASSTLGLEEIGSVGGTMDTSDRGGNQADLRASTAYHPSSAHIPVARVNGITSTLVTPRGGFVSGQSSLMALEGWTVAEALIGDGVALHVAAPRTRREARAWQEQNFDASCHLCTQFTSGRIDEGDEAPVTVALSKEDTKLAKSIDDSWASMRDTLADAREYARRVLAAERDGASMPDYDPRLASLAPYALGVAPIVFRADRADQIADAVRFVRSEGLRGVIGGGREAWKVAKLLAAAEVPVLLGPVLSMPMNGWDPYDAPYSNASILHDAGVRFAFTSSSSSAARNLPYQAGMAVAYGLPEDAAIAALTRNSAEILGFGDELGSLETGKRADVIVTNGSPLQVRTAIDAVIIGGREISLDTKHTRLYERYRTRLLEPTTPSY